MTLSCVSHAPLPRVDWIATRDSWLVACKAGWYLAMDSANIVRLIDRSKYSRSTDRSMDESTDRSIDWWICWLINWSVGVLTDRPVDRSTGWFTGRSIVWLAHNMIGRLVDWLIDRSKLADRLDIAAQIQRFVDRRDWWTDRLTDRLYKVVVGVVLLSSRQQSFLPW